MDTNTLQAFLAVAAHASFSLAAEKLHITQPAVSKRVAALEEELGARLFERLGRRVLLTEAGRVLLPRARRIMGEMAESRHLVAGLAAEVAGSLQLATSHHIGLHRLPGILRDYSRRYPRVELDLRFLDSEKGWAAVAAGEVELAVVTLPDNAPEQLALLALWDDPLMVMVSRDHPVAAASRPVTALAAWPAILPERGTVTRRLIDRGLASASIMARAGVETNYLETIRMLVMAGLGWSVLPLSMHDKQLITIELPGTAFFRRLGLVTHRGRSASRAAGAFIDLLANRGPATAQGERA